MKIAAIHEMIEMAKTHEKENGTLAEILEARIAQPAFIALQLPSDNAIESLVEFITTYIEHVPEFIEATRSITATAGILEHAEAFLQLAEVFFLKPPQIIERHFGLHELMYEAYLAHRLMEEVNDRFMIRASVPLIPMDMTKSNLIVHTLIGEPFANELEDAVHFTVERAMMKEHVYNSDAFRAYIEQHKDNQWELEFKNWPCLTDELAVNIQLNGFIV